MQPRACALIKNTQDELLLIHRIKDDREYWVFPGGSIEMGESKESAIIREVYEETSLTAKNPIFAFENIQSASGQFQSFLLRVLPV